MVCGVCWPQLATPCPSAGIHALYSCSACNIIHTWTWTCRYMYDSPSIHVMNTKERLSNTTRHDTNTETAFLELHLRWDSNPCLMHSRSDALPTELLRQFSWLSSISHTNQSKAKAKQVSQPDKQVNSNLVLTLQTHTE